LRRSVGSMDSFATIQEERRCRKTIRSSKLIVAKIGASSLSDSSGSLDNRKVRALSEEVAHLRKRGISVILVSSGAIRAGRATMSMKAKNSEIAGLQALAAVGQVVLMEAYREIMSELGCTVAQILLTWDDFRNKRRLRNLMNTINGLISLGVIPIINENDTIAVDEIKFGDNDTLSALVAKCMQADLLVLLSNIGGLYSGDPSEGGSWLITGVKSITPEIERLVSQRHGGFGGMATKLKAAKIATEAGIPMVIANSATENVVGRIIDGKNLGTIFLPRDQNEQ
jgi:glutamate 5-kinase